MKLLSFSLSFIKDGEFDGEFGEIPRIYFDSSFFMRIFVEILNCRPMARIYFKLSRRVQPTTGKSEIIIRLRNGKDYDILAKSGIFIVPCNFKEEGNGYGVVSVNRRKIDNDIEYHKQQETTLKNLETHILDMVGGKAKEEITKEWLADVIDRFVHPEKYAPIYERKDVYDLFNEYLGKKQYSEDYHRGNLVMIRSVARYEAFTRLKKRKDFTFDIDKVTKEDIEDYRDYLRKEKQLSEEHPKLFKRILANYPANVKKGNNTIDDRGENAVFKLLKKLKAFFAWLNEEGMTDNRPFEGVRLGKEQFGTPYYITIEERNTIASTPMPSKHLTIQRDIFVFHCFVGCRVSDLMRLTTDNISGGILTYTPHKTKDDGEQALVARVPLHPKAVELIEKYKGIDRKGRLFPFISPQKYNDAIKEVFTISGITRYVEVRNALTGDIERRPINEVASSHLARRTFVGNAYFKVADPNIIGKMSGHVEGSKAFARYRNIEDETLKEVINLIG